MNRKAAKCKTRRYLWLKLNKYYDFFLKWYSKGYQYRL